MEVGVAIVIPHPLFHSLTAFFRNHIHGEGRILCNTVVHGMIPLVVTLHPSEVKFIPFLIAELCGIGASAIDHAVGVAHSTQHGTLARTAAGQEPVEEYGILVLGQIAVGVAQRIRFIGKDVAHI